jgi:hypothetical protein
VVANRGERDTDLVDLVELGGDPLHLLDEPLLLQAIDGHPRGSFQDLLQRPGVRPGRQMKADFGAVRNLA